MGNNGNGGLAYKAYDSSTSMNDSVGEVISAVAVKPEKPKQKKTTPKKKRKIVILGTAESRQGAPYNDPTYEIWGLQVSLTYQEFSRYSRLYELHYKDYWSEKVVLDRIMKMPEGIDIWMQEKYPEIPHSKKYPLEEIVEGFHANFTSSIAYMLAHAAYEQRTLGNIGLVEMWGVHMMADEEYGHQRPGCEYWLGILEALGTKVKVMGNGAVLKCSYKYGYDKEWALLSDESKRKQQLEIGLKELGRKREELTQHYYQQEGAIKQVDWTIRRIQ